MKVVLYSTDCPRCNVLKRKLEDKGIPFTLTSEVDEIIKMGFTYAPVLAVDDKYMEFVEANKWINDYVN